MRARHAVNGVLLLAVAVCLAACSGSTQGATSGASPPPSSAVPSPAPSATVDGAGGRTVRWAVRDVEHVVPGDATSRDEVLVVSALFEPLTRLDGAGRPRRALATSWEASDDGRRWRFTLDEQARFVDSAGEAIRRVEADDLVFAWERAVREGRAGFLLRDVAGYQALADGDAARLEGVEAVDATTFEVELSRPHGAFDIVVSHPSLAPLPRERWRADADGERDRPVGNGPFRMAEATVPGRYIRAQPVEGWHGRTPAVDEVLFQTMGADSAYVAFQQDRLDVGPVPDDALDLARQEYGTAGAGGRGGGVLTEPTGDLLALGVDVDTEPLDDPEVRRALSLAIDRTALTASDVPGADQPATSLLPPGLPEGGDGRCGHCRHDPAAAAATFAAHEVDELTIWVDTDAGQSALARRLRRDLGMAGVSLEVERRPFAAWSAAVRDGEAPLFRIGWAPEHRTGLDVLGPLLARDGVWSHTGLVDDELARLIDEARATRSRIGRETALREAEARALELAAVIPLAYGEHRTVIAERLAGLRLDALGRADLSRLRLDADAG